MKRNRRISPGVSSIHRRLTILAYLILAVSSLSFSQTSKGLWMVGGDFGYNKYEDQNNVRLAPNGGYLITDQLAAGLSLNLSGVLSDWVDGYSAAFTPFVRYYFGSGKTQPLLTASAGHRYFHYSYNNNPDYEESNWTFHWNVGAGVSHFVNRNAAIQGIVGYNGDFSISFGFQIFLGKTAD